MGDTTIHCDDDGVTQPVPAGSPPVHKFATVFALGDAQAGARPAAERVHVIQAVLHVGRRPASERGTGISQWVVADKMVSSAHARIRRGDRGWEIEDLGSRNGTFVDGRRITLPATLYEGALLFFGNQAAVFRFLTESELAAIRAEATAPFGPVPTVSPTLAMVCRRLRALAKSGSEILLTGETGTGKEVYARAVHEASGRAGRFVAINCAGIPRDLVESELFGYVKGAHSTAYANRPGLIALAEGGTLFLDEIGEMPTDLQTKLLRFVQTRELTPLGTATGRPADVRIIAATAQAFQSDQIPGLRADLAARLGAEPVRLPPLRDRREDLGSLLAHYLPGRRPLELDAFRALCLYVWPRNVRELEKVATEAEILARESTMIGFEHLPRAIAQVLGAPAPMSQVPSEPIPGERPAGDNAGQARAFVEATIPRRAVRRAAPNPVELEELLLRCDGNVAEVARILSRRDSVVWRWIRRFNIDPRTARGEAPPLDPNEPLEDEAE